MQEHPAALRTEKLFIAALALLGLLRESRPISDNSMLTHLRTGAIIAHGGGIPRHDPYSFTAFHHAWVAQSWLAEATYGWLDRIGGLRLVVLEQAVLTGLLALTIAWLARTGKPATTAAAGAIAVFMGAGYWAPRPLLFGLLGLAVTVAISEGRPSPWWLVPVVWAWVSTHGSFPLGLVWLVTSAVGEAIDGRGVISRRRLMCVGTFLVGLVAAVVNPLGPKLLLFPLIVEQKHSVFKAITEWRSPNFQTGAGLLALVGLVFGAVVLLRGRVSWKYSIPAAVFVGLALYSARNVPAAAIVLAPALGQALRRVPPEPEAAEAAEVAEVDEAAEVADSAAAAEASVGRPAGRPARGALPLDRVFAGLIAAVALIGVLTVFRRQPLQLSGYPVAAMTWIEQSGLRGPEHRMAETDIAGNYLDYRYGTDARVFIDDRYDMYPDAVSRDSEALFFVEPSALQVLDRYRVDVVLWPRDQPLVVLLKASGAWREVHRADGWVVMQRVPR